MNILVTGAKGFVGRNLCENLKNIRDGKDRTRSFSIENVFEYDIDSSTEELEEYCSKADFIFNLAGVNRPKDNSEFMSGNFGFASTLLDTLKKYNNKSPVMLSSSIQATLIGRYGESDYGKSKLVGENLFPFSDLSSKCSEWRNRVNMYKLVYFPYRCFGCFIGPLSHMWLE